MPNDRTMTAYNRVSRLRPFIGVALGVVVAATIAPQPAIAVTIREIAVRASSDRPVDNSFVLARIRSRAGMPLDQSRISHDVRALLDTGRFADVRAELETLPDDTARLVYVLKRKWTLAAPVIIESSTRIRESRVREWAGLTVGDYVSQIDADAAAFRVRDGLIKQRYHQARVDARIEPHDGQGPAADVRLVIDRGPRTFLAQVSFSGNRVFSDAELYRIMRLPRRWNPINWVRRHRYRPAMLDHATDLVRDHYRDAGYLDAKAGPSMSREIHDGRRHVVVPVEEGPLYRIGEIAIEGAELWEADTLRQRIDLQPGDTASIGRIQAAAGTLREVYTTAGYRRTAVTPDLLPRPDEETVVDIRFNVREGELTDLRMVFIRGNRKTRDKVIRRELLVAPGDRYDEVRIRRSENRLRNLGFFSHVASYTEDWAPGVSDIIFEVEDQQTGQFMVGVGFSSIDKVVGFVELSQGNFDLFNWPYFTGGGQKLNLRAQFGSESRDYEISFVEPWFLNRRLSLGVDAFVQSRSYRDYEVERVGGAIGLGVPLRGPHRLDVGYRLERINLVKVADTNLYTGADGREFFFQEQGRRGKSTVNLYITRDTRDSFVQPSRGHRLRVGGTWSGGPLGFDTDTYSLEVRGAVHVPLWFKHVLSLHARAKTVDTHGDADEVPLSDRLFAGGPRTVRGFRYRDVGPKAVRIADDGRVIRRPQGGRSMAVAGAEYTLPVVDGIRLAGFVDAGNVWLDAYDVHPDDMAVGAGFGIRFDLPGFPIRIDYAWPLRHDEPETRTERFSFWIGHGF